MTYLRALISYSRAQNAAGIDRDLLARSIQFYQDALAAPDKPEGADIEFNANMGLGQCYLLQTLAGDLPDYSKATAAFQAVISAYEQSKEPRLQELAGDAHGRLGLIHRLKGEKDAAIKEYQTAVDLLARYPKRQQIYQQSLADLQK